jgi:hypothetical protein
MKQIIFLSIVFISISCNEKASKLNEATFKVKTTEENQKLDEPSDELKKCFIDFRDALYQNDRIKVKTYFNFPIQDERNGIWYVAFDHDDKEVENISYEKTTPFNEEIFDKKYTNIFPKRFIKSLLKIKSDSLFSKGNYETTKIKEGNMTYYCSSTIDYKEKTFNLTVYYDEPVFEKLEDGTTVEEEGEYMVSYKFKIEKNCIKFKQIDLAG